MRTIYNDFPYEIILSFNVRSHSSFPITIITTIEQGWSICRLTFNHLRSRCVCHDLNSKIVKSICRALALIPIVTQIST
jgi:hypothetical protein